MIYITNTLYLAEIETLGKRPLIGWQSIITTTNLTADSEDVNYPLINLWNPDTSSYWQAESVPTDPTIYVNFTNTGQDQIDYLGIVRHNFGSAAITYTLQNSTTGSEWTDVFSAQSVGNDKAIIHFFDASTRIYWRLKLVCGTSTPPYIAHAKLGKALILRRPIYVGHAPATLSKKASRNTDLSDSGEYLGQIVSRRFHRTECIQKNTDPDWIRTYLLEFINHTQLDRDDDDTPQGAFFFAWRPTDHPTEVIYGWTEEDIEPRNQLANGLMEYNFGIQGVL